MFCKYCGSEIDNDSSFCQSCGKRVTNLSSANESNEYNHTKSQLAANKTKIKPVVHDDTYEPNPYITQFGFLLLFLTIFAIFINQTEFVYDKNFEIFRVVVIALGSLLRLFSTIIVIQTAKEQNRNPLSWGIFAFLLPSFALIGIGQMPKIVWQTSANMRIGYMAGLTEIPLGGSNAIGLWFGQKDYYWAFFLYFILFTLNKHW